MTVALFSGGAGGRGGAGGGAELQEQAFPPGQRLKPMPILFGSGQTGIEPTMRVCIHYRARKRGRELSKKVFKLEDLTAAGG